jgi:hypothetical protein
MIFFFHHYELPAILRRGAHIVAEGQIIEGQLELELLNPTGQNNAGDNLNEPVQNAGTENTEMNLSTNDADGNNATENSSDLDAQESRSNSNNTLANGETSLRQRIRLPSDGEVINNGGPSSAQTHNIDSPWYNLENNRTS